MLEKSTFRRFKRSRNRSEGGYILLTLLLFVALLAILAGAVEESITQQVKRDREEELIHRGVQYSRAVRRYYKKFGSYPTSVDQLMSSNNLRFLRKKYKDPMSRDPKTGQEKDFKPLHQGEVQMSFGGGLQGGAALNALAQNAGVKGGQGLATAIAAATGQQGATGPQANLNASDASDAGSPDQDSNGATPAAQTGPGISSGTGGSSSSGQVFGGGPIVGVVSTSKAASIRSFNKKDHYNQWQFIYDPTSDRGGLLMTPNQPPLNIGANGQPGQTGNGQPGSGISGTGFSNQPTSPGAPPAQQQPQPQETQQ
jgi:type II secretory pathway pseudopilin PulG